MPTQNPSRKRNRTRGLAGLAADPVAFARDSENRHRIDQRERMRPLAASGNYSQRAILASVLADPVGYRPLTVTTPARDARGRRNPRMRPSTYTV